MSPRRAVLSIFVLGCLATLATACTTAVFQDGDALLFARNFDWYWGDGLIVVNQRGIQKTAFVQPDEKPAKWTSEFGSITFNQFGREMPFGGMNEAGLVVEQMMLFESEYPQPDERSAVNMLQWLQYQLDTCDTVDEVIASDANIRIELPRGPERIHYLVCDADGHVATIEFLDGKMQVHRGETLPLTALTNNTYADSTTFAKKHMGLGGDKPMPQGRDSLHRFARAAKCCQDFKCSTSDADRDYCFQALGSVAQGRATVWSIVYDIPKKRIYLRTSANEKVRWLDFEDFDLSPEADVLHLNINSPDEGDLAGSLTPLTEEQHREFMSTFFARQDVQSMFGDLNPMIEGLNQLLRTYRRTQPAEATLEATPVAVGIE